MRRNLFKLLVFMYFALIAWASVRCPIDKSDAYFTGKIKVDTSSRTLHQYQCFSYNHKFWVVID